jgi:histidyl-tRNA synthetase
MSVFPNNLLQSPSGFPELLPSEAIAEQKINDVIRKHFELAGFSPINTPFVERTEVLTAKSEGEINTQMYGLRLMNPDTNSPTDSKDLVLRYDHTVPLARYVVAHNRELTFPFRRYAIGPVFRGEKPKEGRYRQFNQADIDVIGDGSLDQIHDAECVAIIANIFNELNIGEFIIRIGNRKILQSILAYTGIEDDAELKAISIIDKADKIGVDKTIEMLKDIPNINLNNLHTVIDILWNKTTPAEILENLSSLNIDDELFKTGIAELKAITSGLSALGINQNNFRVDLSIVRGLGYYTGNVFETFLIEYPELGSIASGGRYENLAGSFTIKSLPGVGMSIGTTRLLFKLIKIGLIKTDESTIAPVIITTALPLLEYGNIYLEQAKRLRDVGINTEVYLTDRALQKELEYANKKGFKIALITRENEIKEGLIIVKNLISGEQVEAKNEDLEKTVMIMLNKLQVSI